jgi:hypothetical protein
MSFPAGSACSLQVFAGSSAIVMASPAIAALSATALVPKRNSPEAPALALRQISAEIKGH